MPHRSRLIPLLVAALLIQSLAAVLPHVHDAIIDGGDWQSPSHIETTHHCFACSVNAPVVEAAAEFGHAAGTTYAFQVPLDRESSSPPSIVSSAGPRGPPRLV